jgi:hypothetical protein
LRSSVVGSGSGHFIETGGPFELTVNARGEGPLAQGHVRGSGDYVGEFQVEGPVTCMLVVGNRASIKYRFSRSEGPGAPPQPPESFDAAAGVCTDPTLNPAWNRIESGDYVVRDAG